MGFYRCTSGLPSLFEPATIEGTAQDLEGEERIEAIRKGEVAENVYSEVGREELLDDDEIAPWEEAFMEGAEGRGGQASCKQCGKLLSQDKSSVVEKKFGDHNLFFCSDICVEEYSNKEKE